MSFEPHLAMEMIRPRSFLLKLALRLLLVLVLMAALVTLWLTPGHRAGMLLLLLLTLSAIFELWRLVSRSNAELNRFLSAARHADFSQRFDFSGSGSQFENLGNTFNEILSRFRDRRGRQEEQLRHLRALVEHIPVPLLGVRQDGTVALHNNASRRLFGATTITRTEQLQAYGGDFASALVSVRPGERRLVVFVTDGMEQRMTLACTEVAIAGEVERLVSLQDIQSELDITQLQAWQDLVRVLTHEIMNSITPVSSLAKTSATLVEDAKSRLQDNPQVLEELEDVHQAVTTVARRSDSLTRFVQSYRRLTRLPDPERRPIALGEFFRELSQLLTAEWPARGLQLEIGVEPENLSLRADRSLLEQVLINLLQNAEHALEDREQGNISLKARLNQRGRIAITVSDNGPGVSIEVGDQVFVPFFTTRREGSGVGLALTRQVMIAHGGSVTLSKTAGGGATFTLIF